MLNHLHIFSITKRNFIPPFHGLRKRRNWSNEQKKCLRKNSHQFALWMNWQSSRSLKSCFKPDHTKRERDSTEQRILRRNVKVLETEKNHSEMSGENFDNAACISRKKKLYFEIRGETGLSWRSYTRPVKCLTAKMVVMVTGRPMFATVCSGLLKKKEKHDDFKFHSIIFWIKVLPAISELNVFILYFQISCFSLVFG